MTKYNTVQYNTLYYTCILNDCVTLRVITTVADCIEYVGTQAKLHQSTWFAIVLESKLGVVTAPQYNSSYIHTHNDCLHLYSY